MVECGLLPVSCLIITSLHRTEHNARIAIKVVLHVVDEVAYDVIAMYKSKSAEEIVSELFSKYSHRDDVSEEELYSALEEPERHRDIIVRVGGFSEYFVNLDRELQRNVIERTVNGV